jgi:hypothetical protein
MQDRVGQARSEREVAPSFAKTIDDPVSAYQLALASGFDLCLRHFAITVARVYLVRIRSTPDFYTGKVLMYVYSLCFIVGHSLLQLCSAGLQTMTDACVVAWSGHAPRVAVHTPSRLANGASCVVSCSLIGMARSRQTQLEAAIGL